MSTWLNRGQAHGHWEVGSRSRVGEAAGRLLREPRSLHARRPEKQVRLVFADTVYWGALVHAHDQYRSLAIQARKALGEVRLVTTDGTSVPSLFGSFRWFRGPAHILRNRSLTVTAQPGPERAGLNEVRPPDLERISDSKHVRSRSSYRAARVSTP